MPVVKQSINNLYTWALENNKALIDEFVGEDEAGNPIDIQNISKASHKKLKWHHTINGKEHTWLATVADRTAKNSGCPICNSRNKAIAGKNDLYTWCKDNGDFGEILMQQWVGLTEAGKLVNMQEVSRGASKTKVLWQCECGNTWLATPLHRIYHKSVVCPRCSKQKSTEKRINNLLENNTTFEEWCIQNGLRGAVLLQEFAGVDDELNQIEPNKLTFASHRRMLWMHQTKTGDIHSWYATIHNRVLRHSNCPYCNNKSTSLNEQILYRCFKQLYPDTISRGKYHGYEYDVFVPDINLYIEYGSEYFHEGKEERDKEKEDICINNGGKFVRVTDIRNKEIQEVWRDNLIEAYLGSNVNKTYEVIKFIFKIYDLDISKIDFGKAVKESITFMQS